MQGNLSWFGLCFSCHSYTRPYCRGVTLTTEVGGLSFPPSREFARKVEIFKCQQAGKEKNLKCLTWGNPKCRICFGTMIRFLYIYIQIQTDWCCTHHFHNFRIGRALHANFILENKIKMKQTDPIGNHSLLCAPACNDMTQHFPAFVTLCLFLPTLSTMCYPLPTLATAIICYLPLFTIFSHHLPPFATMCHHLPPFATICHDLPRFATICRFLPSFPTICHHLPPCATILPPFATRHLPPFATISHHLPQFATICHDLPPFATICHHVPPFCQHLPPFATICHPPFATICHHLPPFTTICHDLPRFATICHHLPPFATICHDLPPFATICHHLPRFASTCNYALSICCCLLLLAVSCSIVSRVWNTTAFHPALFCVMWFHVFLKEKYHGTSKLYLTWSGLQILNWQTQDESPGIFFMMDYSSSSILQLKSFSPLLHGNGWPLRWKLIHMRLGRGMLNNLQLILQNGDNKFESNYRHHLGCPPESVLFGEPMAFAHKKPEWTLNSSHRMPKYHRAPVKPINSDIIHRYCPSSITCNLPPFAMICLLFA